MSKIILNRVKLAKLLDVSRLTIYKWEKAGLPTLRHRRFVRYELDEVKKWLKADRNGDVEGKQ